MLAEGVLFRETRTLTQAEFDRFARISGDDNPIHVDAEFSARTRFGRTVAHGMLLYTVLWGLVQRHAPGSRQTAQALMFPNPAFADEQLVFEGSVSRSDPASASLALRVTRTGTSEILCEATAEIAPVEP